MEMSEFGAFRLQMPPDADFVVFHISCLCAFTFVLYCMSKFVIVFAFDAGS